MAIFWKNRVWKFDQAENVAAITDIQVIQKKLPILMVIHYSGDHSWAFVSGKSDPSIDGKIVSMAEIYKIDKTIDTIAHLLPGFVATRTNIGDDWKIEKDENM